MQLKWGAFPRLPQDFWRNHWISNICFTWSQKYSLWVRVHLFEDCQNISSEAVKYEILPRPLRCKRPTRYEEEGEAEMAAVPNGLIWFILHIYYGLLTLLCKTLYRQNSQRYRHCFCLENLDETHFLCIFFFCMNHSQKCKFLTVILTGWSQFLFFQAVFSDS